MASRSQKVPGPPHLRPPTSGVGAASLRLRTARAVAALGSGAAALMTRYEAFFVLAVAAGYAFVQVGRAQRPLWFDELFTFYISRLPDLGQVFRALPADGNPPLNYLLVRGSLRLLGETSFAIRLPSLLAFTAAVLAVFCFVRRRSGPVFALFGMLSLATCGNAAYGSEARPYALLLGFTGLTLLSWQAATSENRPRVTSLIGLAAGIAGAISSHHYGLIYVGVPLVLGEAVRLFERRRFDLPLYCAGAVGLCMLAATLPFAFATRQILLDYVKESVSFWAKPTIWNVRSYWNMVVYWLPPAFLALLWLTQSSAAYDAKSTPSSSQARPFPAHEAAAAVGLAMLVPIMIVFTWLTTGCYISRYAIGAAMGIAILVGLVTPFLGRSRRHVTGVAALCVLLLGAWLFAPLASTGARAMFQRAKPAPSGSLEATTVLDAAPGREPIVVASALSYARMWWYASPRLRERLHYLADLPFAVHQPDFVPELALVVNREIVPSKVDDYREFLAEHRRFFLYCSGSPRLEWVKERLQAEKWTLRLLRSRGAKTLYIAEAPAP